MTERSSAPAHRLSRRQVLAGLGLAVPVVAAACTDRPRWPSRTTLPPVTEPPTTAPTTAPTTPPPTAPPGVNAVTFVTAEFTITRTEGVIKAGENFIIITNEGQYQHEVIFVKAESYDALPKKENGAIDMSRVPAGDITGEHHMHLDSGQSATQTASFTPGRWVAFCNIEHNGASHFARGQYLEFTVI